MSLNSSLMRSKSIFLSSRPWILSRSIRSGSILAFNWGSTFPVEAQFRIRSSNNAPGASIDSRFLTIHGVTSTGHLGEILDRHSIRDQFETTRTIRGGSKLGTIALVAQFSADSSINSAVNDRVIASELDQSTTLK